MKLKGKKINTRVKHKTKKAIKKWGANWINKIKFLGLTLKIK